MHRKFWMIPTTLVIALSVVTFVSRSVAQDHGAKDDKGAAHAPSQAEMEAMMKAGQPGPEHAEMMKSAGDWDAEVKFNMNGTWTAPSKGSAHFEPVFDGRYMMMKFEGTMDMGMGQPMPFKGMGLMGYDNTKKKYFSTWIDSMSTAMMKTEGTMSGNVCTLTGTMVDPMTGKDCQIREVATHTDADHMSYQMFAPGPDGKEMQMMDIKYTRKK